MKTEKDSHTPGPWWRATDDKGVYEVGSGDVVLCRVSRREVSYGYKAGGTDSGNARLIAAAPELLEACEAMHKACAQLLWAQMGGAAFDKVKKAIKKANPDFNFEEVL